MDDITRLRLRQARGSVAAFLLDAFRRLHDAARSIGDGVEREAAAIQACREYAEALQLAEDFAEGEGEPPLVPRYLPDSGEAG
jgi:hypothetical protein